jgi:hypothetical protein
MSALVVEINCQSTNSGEIFFHNFFYFESVFLITPLIAKNYNFQIRVDTHGKIVIISVVGNFGRIGKTGRFGGFYGIRHTL